MNNLNYAGKPSARKLQFDVSGLETRDELVSKWKIAEPCDDEAGRARSVPDRVLWSGNDNAVKTPSFVLQRDEAEADAGPARPKMNSLIRPV